MFGLLYSIGLGIGAIFSGTKGAINNIQAYNRGLERYNNAEDFSRTYIDRKGCTRDLVSNQFVSVRRSFDYKDDDDLYVWQNGNKVRNVSEEEREYKFQIGKEGNWLNRTADLYDPRNWSLQHDKKVKIKGAFYRDLYNDNIYVCREFYVKEKYTRFYMDIYTGYLVRKSDRQLEIDIKYPNDVLNNDDTNEFINDFNKKQKNGGWCITQDIYSNKLITDYYCNKYNIDDHIYSLYDIKYGGKS